MTKDEIIKQGLIEDVSQVHPEYIIEHIKDKIMKRTICKQCNPQRETIIGVETNCSECGTEIIHIINETK